MKIRILAFATARDALGADELELEVPEETTVGDLRALLTRERPGFDPLWARLAVAVDGSLARPSTKLSPGCEVALLPPVSGGAPRGWLTDEPLDPAEVADRVADPGRGAVVLFLGRVRNRSRGREVVELAYTAYREMAGATLDRIASEIEAATPGVAVAVAHRLGRLLPGDVSVVIATSSPHREAAYATNREVLERLKREVPIWKKERYADGQEVWREEEPLALGFREGEQSAPSRVG